MSKPKVKTRPIPIAQSDRKTDTKTVSSSTPLLMVWRPNPQSQYEYIREQKDRICFAFEGGFLYHCRSQMANLHPHQFMKFTIPCSTEKQYYKKSTDQPRWYSPGDFLGFQMDLEGSHFQSLTINCHPYPNETGEPRMGIHPETNLNLHLYGPNERTQFLTRLEGITDNDALFLDAPDLVLRSV